MRQAFRVNIMIVCLSKIQLHETVMRNDQSFFNYLYLYGLYYFSHNVHNYTVECWNLSLIISERKLKLCHWIMVYLCGPLNLTLSSKEPITDNLCFNLHYSWTNLCSYGSVCVRWKWIRDWKMLLKFQKKIYLSIYETNRM